MKTATHLSLLAMLSTLSATAAAAESATGAGAAPNLSKWQCKLCKFEDGLSGSVEVGGAYVSDSSAKFGEYNGLGDDGGYFIGDLNARFRGKDAAYWDVDAANLGLDTRSLNVEGGRQGRYKLLLNYQELTRFVSDSAQTPFVGSGGASLTLPAGFPADTTTLMPLAGTLRQVDLDTTRKELGVGASWTPARAWQFGANFRHETREGKLGTAGAFFVTASQLIRPVDYVTDQLDASASYTGTRLQGKLAYYGSSFSNDEPSLTWQNPFTAPGFPGAVAGQLALPPDNQFHQISGTLGYQLAERTRATADIAVGRGTQDQQFLAPTLNTTLAAPALPRTSLDGRVDTINANLEVNSAVTDRLRLKAAYLYNDRDNQTPQSTYSWVTTDMFVAPSQRTNLPYSFTQDKVQLRADYKAAQRVTTSAGYDYDSVERTFQEAETTSENTVWARLATRHVDAVDLTLKYAFSDRSYSSYQAVPQITPPENPLLRKYNMANRTRNRGELRANIAAADSVSIGLQFDASDDDYSDSAIGLTSGRELNFGGDLTIMLSDQTSLHVFGNHQEIKSEQSGSQAYSTPDWSGTNKDTINLLGVGIKHIAIKNKLEVGADYTLMRTTGEISVSTAANERPFPDLSSSRNSLKLYATYRLKDNVSLRAGYWYERYESDDWALDGVAPDTISNVLTFGQLAPQYRVHVFAASVRYKF
jgi:MtrB/PioB family decaheme-associated outer membrane protein